MKTQRQYPGYRVIYREGGKQRFRWKITYPLHSTHEKAKPFAEKVERMGYKVLIKTDEELINHGLPETWDAGDSIENLAVSKNGWTINI